MLTSKVTTTINIDNSGNIFLYRILSVYVNGVWQSDSAPSILPITYGQTQGYDQFTQTNGAPTLTDLSTLAGDRWPALQALIATIPAPQETQNDPS